MESNSSTPFDDDDDDDDVDGWRHFRHAFQSEWPFIIIIRPLVGGMLSHAFRSDLLLLLLWGGEPPTPHMTLLTSPLLTLTLSRHCVMPPQSGWAQARPRQRPAISQGCEHAFRKGCSSKGLHARDPVPAYLQEVLDLCLHGLELL